jgi:hypothetical protein
MTSQKSSLKTVSFLGEGPKIRGFVAPAAKFMLANHLEAGVGEPPKMGRRRIWDLHGHYHCSIVGTCLSTAELRKLLVKLGMAAATDSDHDLHGRGVGLAARQDAPGKLLNKLLDERHQVVLKRYARAQSEAELTSCWRDDIKAGDIPGGYWAVLTHPAATDGLLREAFGYVHMLSHLVGAANRADIRRLQQLETENALLADKLERQQARIRDISLSRDATRRELQAERANRTLGDGPGALLSEEASSLSVVLVALRKQLESEAQRRIVVEERLACARQDAAAARDAAQEVARRALTLQAELDAVEGTLLTGLTTQTDTAAEPLELDGLTVLYVGGRPTQIPHIRQAATQRGGTLLHHDGGVEDNDLILATLVSRADIIFFPVDCVSHSAVITVKRSCRQVGKPFVPLRSTAVTSFVAGLSASLKNSADDLRGAIQQSR